MTHSPDSPPLGELWRRYLEQYADHEGDIEAQTLVAAHHAFGVFSALGRLLDPGGRYRPLIDQREAIFTEGCRHARTHPDRMLNAAFALYNALNTLGHQLSGGNQEAAGLIAEVDARVRAEVAAAAPSARAGTALAACFPLLGLVTIAADGQEALTEAIRHVERRFADGMRAARTDRERLLCALYRMVEMLQLFALATDAGLRDRIDQIATRFREEDRTGDEGLKERNGFCRLFELGHLLAVQVDALL